MNNVDPVGCWVHGRGYGLKHESRGCPCARTRQRADRLREESQFLPRKDGGQQANHRQKRRKAEEAKRRREAERAAERKRRREAERAAERDAVRKFFAAAQDAEDAVLPSSAIVDPEGNVLEHMRGVPTLSQIRKWSLADRP